MTGSLFHKIYAVIHAAVFPAKCLVCGLFFQLPGAAGNLCANRRLLIKSAEFSCPEQIKSPLTPFLCPDCLQNLQPVQSPLCTVCGMPFKSRQGPDHRCGECLDAPKKYRIARAALVYDQTLTAAIHCFKYHGKIQLAAPFGQILLATLGLFWEKNSIDLIIPVPLHRQRLRQRGFNQAYLLLRNWKRRGAYIEVPGFCGVELAPEALTRIRPTAPQTALGRRQRAENIKNAFALRDRERIRDKTVLLIDDVYTTGATVNECARLLVGLGARQVDVLTLARTV